MTTAYEICNINNKLHTEKKNNAPQSPHATYAKRNAKPLRARYKCTARMSKLLCSSSSALRSACVFELGILMHSCAQLCHAYNTKKKESHYSFSKKHARNYSRCIRNMENMPMHSSYGIYLHIIDNHQIFATLNSSCTLYKTVNSNSICKLTFPTVAVRIRRDPAKKCNTYIIL